MISKRVSNSLILVCLTLTAFLLGLAWRLLAPNPMPGASPHPVSVSTPSPTIAPTHAPRLANQTPRTELAPWVQAALTERRNKVQRPKGEWQGMKVEANQSWPCYQNSCSLARACIEGRCLPCSYDDQCEDQESCLFNHCVRNENIECRSKKDCLDLRQKPGEKKGEDVWCVLSGYSTTDLRNNEEMRAYCLVPSGAAAEPQNSASSERMAQDREPQSEIKPKPEADEALSSLRSLLNRKQPS